jgi:hypothetical protein
LYSSPGIIRIIKSRRMRWAVHVARMWQTRNVYRLLVGKPEGKGPLGRPRRRWIDNIMINLLEIGLGVVDWIGLAQDRYSWRALVNSVMNLGFHKMLGNYRMAAQLVASRVVLSSTESIYLGRNTCVSFLSLYSRSWNRRSAEYVARCT